MAEPDPTRMKRCVVHNNNAMPKDRHCSGWWWANGGDPKAGLASPCEFEPEVIPKQRYDDMVELEQFLYPDQDNG